MDLYLASLVSGLVLLVAFQVIIARAIIRQQRSVEELSDRLSHMLAALSLLTDSTESGLRDIITELERAATEAPRARQAADTTRRISAAAKRGRSVQEIASKEQVSEGEVKLRLHLGGARRKAAAAQAAAR